MSAAAVPQLIVIDGPAGAGKTTIARRLARHLGLPLLDTGAIYRSLALEARGRGVAWDDEPALVALASALPIRFGALPGPGQPDASSRPALDSHQIRPPVVGVMPYVAALSEL